MSISFILPTRNRSEMLTNSVNSIFNTMTSKDFEILIAVDDDDDTESKIKNQVYDINWQTHVKWFTFERYGYRGFHKYVNQLASYACGNFLFLWNDDCVMENHGWYESISEFEGKFNVLNPLVTTMQEYCRHNNQILFPIIPKKWFEITGRWSNNCACDTWIQDISRELHTTISLDNVKISHQRYDVSGLNNDEIYAETRKDIEEFIRSDFYSQHQFNERQKDFNKISNYLSQQL